MRHSLFIVLILFGFTGCATLNTGYVIADQATLAAIGDDYIKYINADPTLTPQEKAFRIATVTTWRNRVAAALQSGSIYHVAD
jgi:hypothetical protein